MRFHVRAEFGRYLGVIKAAQFVLNKEVTVRIDRGVLVIGFIILRLEHQR
jgi:hypothetical protein